MGKNKRSRQKDVPEEVNSVHLSRKKRVKYSEEDAKLVQIYDSLADEVQSVRIKAASNLLKKLSTKSPDQRERLDTSLTRLIKGLCSGRKQARLGFSVALTEVLRLVLNPESALDGSDFNLHEINSKIHELTLPDGKASGQERRDSLLGRRFAFQAVLQSNVAHEDSTTSKDWLDFLYAVFELSRIKSWLRQECGSMLYEYLISPPGAKLGNDRVKDLVFIMRDRSFLRTPEGVGLWLTITQNFPGVDLPTGVWEHNDPLFPKNRASLCKTLLGNTADNDSKATKDGARQSTPSFAWSVILLNLYRRAGSCETDEEARAFNLFWEDAAAFPMFSSSSSTERKSLGLQIFSSAVAAAPKERLAMVLHPKILRCILDQRASSERYLFDAAKAPLNQMVARAKREPKVTGVLVEELLGSGAVNFDQLTKTKTVESIISHADESSLRSLASAIDGMIVESHGGNEAHTNAQRRMLADLLLSMVRLHRDPSGVIMSDGERENLEDPNWMNIMLRNLAELAYSPQLETSPSLSSASRTVFRSRLMSCLNLLLDCPLEHAVKGPVSIVWFMVGRLTTSIAKSHKRAAQAVLRGRMYMDSCYISDADKSGSHAFTLLFALSILQVWNEEPDAVSALEDLTLCYTSKDEDSGGSMTTTLVELLLSFISKPSALFRKLAEQVFSAFAAELTEDGLKALVDILEQKETLSGQQELFDQHDSDLEDVGSDSGEDDDDQVDVEDASDVEIVNGGVVGSSNSDEDVGNDDASKGSSAAERDAFSDDDDDDDEEAIFDKKLADALGTTGEDNDSDDDGSDMDDEQMMALEPHLTTIFKQRRNQTSKKQDRKDAKDNILNFKNRVLDLLMIYVKGQYSNVLALDLIFPLVTLVRTTTSKPTAEKAFAVQKQYFESCNKNKSFPQPHDHKSCFDILASVHEEMKCGGSKIHANACSRSSLFLTKVLVAMEPKYYQRVASMYAGLESEWYLDPKSKVQGSVFTEWTSWSIATRQHA